MYRIFRRFGEVVYSFFGIVFLVTLAIVFFFHARSFMLAELFIPLLASGAIFIEEKLSGITRGKGIRITAVSYLIAGGILVAPVSLPMLPLELLPAYSRAFGFLSKPVKDFSYTKTLYPLEFSMRIGWEQLVRKVAEVYYSLPPEDREKAVIWAALFGEAGAIDLYGPRYGLPHAVSGQLNYFLWGPGEKSWDILIAVAADSVLHKISLSYWDIQKKAFVADGFSMSFNKNYICVCRVRQMSKEAIWARLKAWPF